jgi:hypothetical protein
MIFERKTGSGGAALAVASGADTDPSSPPVAGDIERPRSDYKIKNFSGVCS